MRLGRAVRWYLALGVFAVVVVATGPTIWRDGVSNLHTYLHVSRAVAMGLIVGLLVLIVLVPASLRLRNRLRVRHQHKAARADALRHLQG
jgi:type VI protein secretion system component VasK